MRYRQLVEATGDDLLGQLLNPDLVKLRRVFLDAERDIRFVGGSVRSLLHGEIPKDIDLATDATPEEQIAIYESAGLSERGDSLGRFVKTGLAHGTITVILGKRFAGYGSGPYEITSLRTETDHDGRHATVAYTHDWTLDLSRRDLTVNAMALTFDGVLIDPFGGQHDLKHGIVRFVGDADQRIREDYLRILRFFRFDGRIGHANVNDVATEQAIRRNAAGLERISGERIWSEVAKILAGPRAAHMIAKMCALDVAQHIGLPCSNIAALRAATIRTRNPVSLLSVLMRTAQDVATVVGHWKLSGAERDLLAFLVEHRADTISIEHLQDLVIDSVPAIWAAELARLHGDSGMANAISSWIPPRFPVTGRDLMALGMKPGTEMGATLARLKQKWLESRFALDKDALLALR